MPHFAASDPVLHCLQISYKKDTRLIWVNLFHSIDYLIHIDTISLELSVLYFKGAAGQIFYKMKYFCP